MLSPSIRIFCSFTYLFVGVLTFLDLSFALFCASMPLFCSECFTPICHSSRPFYHVFIFFTVLFCIICLARKIVKECEMLRKMRETDEKRRCAQGGVFFALPSSRTLKFVETLDGFSFRTAPGIDCDCGTKRTWSPVRLLSYLQLQCDCFLSNDTTRPFWPRSVIACIYRI